MVGLSDSDPIETTTSWIAMPSVEIFTCPLVSCGRAKAAIRSSKHANLAAAGSQRRRTRHVRPTFSGRRTEGYTTAPRRRPQTAHAPAR